MYTVSQVFPIHFLHRSLRVVGIYSFTAQWSPPCPFCQFNFPTNRTCNHWGVCQTTEEGGDDAGLLGCEVGEERGPARRFCAFPLITWHFSLGANGKTFVTWRSGRRSSRQSHRLLFPAFSPAFLPAFYGVISELRWGVNQPRLFFEPRRTSSSSSSSSSFLCYFLFLFFFSPFSQERKSPQSFFFCIPMYLGLFPRCEFSPAAGADRWLEAVKGAGADDRYQL